MRQCAAALLPRTQTKQQAWLRTAASLADYLWRWSDSQIMGDPADPAFGIVTWNQEHPGPYPLRTLQMQHILFSYIDIHLQILHTNITYRIHGVGMRTGLRWTTATTPPTC
jgi:hypothetical protein